MKDSHFFTLAEQRFNRLVSQALYRTSFSPKAFAFVRLTKVDWCLPRSPLESPRFFLSLDSASLPDPVWKLRTDRFGDGESLSVLYWGHIPDNDFARALFAQIATTPKEINLLVGSTRDSGSLPQNL